MILKTNVEFRGSSFKKNDKGEYHFINLEDENGESSKFSVDFSVDISQFKKGDKVIVEFDYSVKYGSLKVISVKGAK